jgi:hypothetical protein
MLKLRTSEENKNMLNEMYEAIKRKKVTQYHNLDLFELVSKGSLKHLKIAFRCKTSKLSASSMILSIPTNFAKRLFNVWLVSSIVDWV